MNKIRWLAHQLVACNCLLSNQILFVFFVYIFNNLYQDIWTFYCKLNKMYMKYKWVSRNETYINQAFGFCFLFRLIFGFRVSTVHRQHFLYWANNRTMPSVTEATKGICNPFRSIYFLVILLLFKILEINK